jgi:exosome complex component RRP46
MKNTNIRTDRRLPNQLRPMKCEPHVLSRADGSARYSCDKTAVLAAVYGPREIRMKNEQLDRTTVQTEFHHTMHHYEASKLRQYEVILRESLEKVIITAMYPRSLILIVLQVLQDDGSIFSVSFNAAVVALMDAGIPIKGLIGAVTCGMIANDIFYLDLTREEEEQVINGTLFLLW